MSMSSASTTVTDRPAVASVSAPSAVSTPLDRREHARRQHHDLVARPDAARGDLARVAPVVRMLGACAAG